MSGTQTLLLDYVRNGSERAFRELVTSYINFVFSTALRVVGGDKQLAEDVTQTVFVDLARKAVTLPSEVKLGGWLHRHTCFVARKALRRERRRIARERLAMQLNQVEDYTEENLACLYVVLDEAINDLDKKDRSAIILRFFEQLDFRALGEAIGSTEDAARMRVSRALEKIAALLRRRGVVLSIAGLSFVLGAKTATAAPALLIIRVTRVALAQSAKGPGWLALLKHACCTRLNVGILSCAALLSPLILLIPARETEAMLGASTGQGKPADFADLAPDGFATVAPADPPTNIASMPPQPAASEPLIGPEPGAAPRVATIVRRVTAPLPAPRNTNPDQFPSLPMQSSPLISTPASFQGSAQASSGFSFGAAPSSQTGPSLGLGARSTVLPATPSGQASSVAAPRASSPPGTGPNGRPWAPVTAFGQTISENQNPNMLNSGVQRARTVQWPANVPASRLTLGSQANRQRQP